MTGVGIGSVLDARTQAMIDANLEEAREMLANEEEWEWDPGVFQTHMELELNDNYNEAEMNSAPYLPGIHKPREYIDDETLLSQHKDWLMRFSKIPTDEDFERIKKETLLRFENYKKMDTKRRLLRGESLIQSDFMAERQTLADEVAGIHEDNPLHAFAQKAVAALDGNSGWSYDKKIKALKVLSRHSERYQPGAEKQ